LTEQVVGSTPRQSWFSSFFSEMEVEQPQHKREGKDTKKKKKKLKEKVNFFF